MTRLLLGEDLSLYADGRQPGPAPDDPPERSRAELPYYDQRMSGRVLEIGGDGLLVWNQRSALPKPDGRLAGSVLIVDEVGVPIWTPMPPGGSEEVFPTDMGDTGGASVGALFVGPTDPGSSANGDLWIVTRTSVSTPSVIPPTTAPTVTVPASSASQTVTISWTAVPTATAYRVNIDSADVAQVTTLSTSVTLEQGSHTITVRGLNSGGDGPASSPKTCVIANQTPPPVTNLRVVTVTQTTVEVAWDYTPPADFAAFDVTSSVGTVTVAGNGATVSALAADIAITVTVVARDTGGLTSTPNSINARTAPTPPPTAPPAPTNLRTTRVGYSSADVAWNAAPGATSYEVSSNPTSGFSGVGNVGSWGWGGLAEQTAYTLYVRGVNAGGAGPAASVSFTTLPKIAYWVTTHQDRTIGYGAEGWGSTLSYHSSGVLFTTDHWCNQSNANNHLYCVDLNLNTGPYSEQGDRWIQYTWGLSVDYVYDVTGWWGYPGTFRWHAWNSSLSVEQQGAVVAGGGAMAVGPNEKNKTVDGTSFGFLNLTYSAGQGSPGWFKLREFQVHVRQITGQSPVYNPA